MIIGDRREEAIANIAAAAAREDFHGKVEPGDPILTPEESAGIVNGYLQRRKSAAFRSKTFFARQLVNVCTRLINRDTQIIGFEKAAAVTGGAIITCNHFSPLDNTVVRHLTRKLGKKRINIISQVSNFAMTGFLGFIMNYADTIPLGEGIHYMMRQLPQILQELMDRDEFVLIYPEKEMWFNYRKPRPPMRGAYHFAAQLNRPLISCFVEIRDTEEMDTDSFRKVRYVLHVLDVLYPDPEKSLRENSRELSQRDYQLKKAAYEKAYGKALCYEFDPSDIAGWTGEGTE